jgi:hypothetical protein
MISLVNVGVGLISGNFIYQFFTDGNWLLATDRSFFQFIALLCAWLATRDKI